MNKNKLYISITIIFFCNISFAQQSNKCQEILTEEINIENINNKTTTLLSEISKLKNCGLDDLDVQFFSEPVIVGTLFVQLVSNLDRNKIHFKDIYDGIIEYKKSDDYQKYKKLLPLSNDLKKRPATIKNWKNDKVILIKLGVSNETVNQFYTFLKINSDASKTYQEIFIEFKKKQPQENKIETTKFNNLFKNEGVVNFYKLLIQSKKLKKPLLLYFGGYACVNCRKLEETVLKQDLVLKKLKNDVLFINIYVDDRNKLPKNEWYTSKITNKLVKTVGAKNSDFQMTKFKVNHQPYLVLLDFEGNIMNSISYDPNVTKYLDFLENGLRLLNK